MPGFARPSNPSIIVSRARPAGPAFPPLQPVPQNSLPGASVWWLVGNKGNLPSGNPAKIISSATKPTGYDYVVRLGTTQREVGQALSRAIVNLPSGIAAPTGVSNIPGLGQVNVKGPGGAAGAVDDVFTTTGDAITSSLDFLKFTAWIFHPQNVLRAVEFVIGFVLMGFGFHAALQARGEKVEGFSTSEGALSRSGLGRVANELGRAASTRERPARVRSAPHRERQQALTQRYRRESDLSRRRAKAPRPKKKK